MSNEDETPPNSLAFAYSWQNSQWQRLCQQVADQKLPHALLLAGPKGIGKTHFARALGHYLLCLSPVNRVPCGRCKGCELNLATTHPDFAVLQPESGSRVIKIDQVRGLTEFIAKTSQQGGRKVVLIEPAENLNINAANALLKSLEEPSGNSLLILVSHAPSQVMATIRSRCQLLEFALPERGQSLAWLTPLAVGQDPDYLLECASGAPLKALELLNGDLLEQRQSLASGLLAVAYGKQSPLELANDVQRGEPLLVLEALMQWLQQAMRQQLAGLEVQAGQDEHPEKQVQYLLAGTPSAIAYRFWDKLVAVKRQLLSNANPNKQLLLEELMLDCHALLRQSAVLTQSRQQMVNGLV